MPFAIRHRLIFKHRRARTNCTSEVRKWLDEVLHRTWIGRTGQFEWPPRSPDISPQVFFLGSSEANLLSTPFKSKYLAYCYRQHTSDFRKWAMLYAALHHPVQTWRTSVRTHCSLVFFYYETDLVGHAVFVYILWMVLTCVCTGQGEELHAWKRTFLNITLLLSCPLYMLYKINYS